ncbi:MAG: ATP-binding protein [Magnetococcus sp. WYHC-3]
MRPLRWKRRYLLFLAGVFLFLLGTSAMLETEFVHGLEGTLLGDLSQRGRMLRHVLELRAGVPAPEVARDMERVLGVDGRRVQVLSGQGEVLYDSLATQPGPGPEGLSQVLLEALRHGQARWRGVLPGRDREVLAALLPVNASGTAGYLLVAADTVTIDNALIRFRLVLLFMVVLAVVVSLFLTLLSAESLIRALGQLLERASRIALGSGPDGRRGEAHVPLSEALDGALGEVAEELEETVMELAEERGRMHGVLQSMGEGVLAFTREQRVTLINPAAMVFLGLERPPFGQDAGTISGLEDICARLRDPASPGRIADELAFERGGRELRLRVLATPLRGEHGTVLVLRDVTEIRRLEKVRRDFVANVSHELRTPISVIQANAETLLRSGLSDPEMAEVLCEAMERNAKRVAQIVNDLLELSRLEANKYPFRLEPVVLSSVLAQVMDRFEAVIASREAQVDALVSEGLWIQSDEKVLREVLSNLLENALKYTPSPAHIRLLVVEEEGSVRLEVVDNGPGVADVHRPRLFERFYRVDPGRSREVGGTGLGLAIVKHFVERLGGTVGMHPVEPHGSCFWVRLPIMPPEGELGCMDGGGAAK